MAWVTPQEVQQVPGPSQSSQARNKRPRDVDKQGEKPSKSLKFPDKKERKPDNEHASVVKEERTGELDSGQCLGSYLYADLRLL